MAKRKRQPRRPAPLAAEGAAAKPARPERAAAGVLQSSRARRWGLPALALLTGLLAGAAAPGGWGLGAWTVVYVPLFLALDLLLRDGARRNSVRRNLTRTWLPVLGLSWISGLALAALTGGWVVNTAYVYGQLPLPLAHGANLLGFGSLLGLETFVFLALPFVLGWRWPRWGFALVVLWSMAFQAITPRFFHWTYGQLMYPVSALVQIGDIVGSAGLNLPLISLQLLLFALVREFYAPGSAPRRELAAAALGLALLFGGSAGYGIWRTASLARADEAGRPVNLAAIQPNFSLGHLASNPALSLSDRRRSLKDLVADSERALERLQRVEGAPTVLVWPESVYPAPYFQRPGARRAVEQWVRRRGVNLVLTSLTFGRKGKEDGAGRGGVRSGDERAGARSRGVGAGARSRDAAVVYGSSIHVSPDGAPPEVYNKIALIPFGETIPFGDWFPAFRRAIKDWIPQISEFEPGNEYTVFRVSSGVVLAPMICFDAFSQSVAIGMARNGANLGLVLANLAWFGRTNIADLFEFFIRFRAIETRMPILQLSQNGESWYMNSAGRVTSRRLGQFEAGALTMVVRIPETFSFYGAHSREVHTTYLLLLAAMLGWRIRAHRLGQRPPEGAGPAPGE